MPRRKLTSVPLLTLIALTVATLRVGGAYEIGYQIERDVLGESFELPCSENGEKTRNLLCTNLQSKRLDLRKQNARWLTTNSEEILAVWAVVKLMHSVDTGQMLLIETKPNLGVSKRQSCECDEGPWWQRLICMLFCTPPADVGVD